MDRFPFSAPVAEWFRTALGAPTRAQASAWPAIAAGRSTLLLAPTGSGKTLAAFLASLDRLMFGPPGVGCRVLYVSPLKALGVDVERNLRAPLVGIAAVAERRGIAHRVPEVGVRTGDTPAAERARLLRSPPDVLITTPESLYLLLTSRAREQLGAVETVIVDEIHAMAGTKRGAHLFLSLERLEALRGGRPPLQRIGLSATQRPLEEVARLLGGGVVGDDGAFRPRPVEIVDAAEPKAFELVVEVPVDDLADVGARGEEGPGDPGRSIWPAIYPRILELIRAHRSTLVFVNSRRLAERLAGGINELAGEEIALAHHGSIAKDRRRDIEDRLKLGQLPALVATSTLELGIDMGAIDLVVQVEAPPSVAAGLQRLGRAQHHVGGVSKGVLFPKFRGDLLATAGAVLGMREGKVEPTRYPRNPLDVLAQQIVAMTTVETLDVDALHRRVRGAAPWADLPRASFEGVLDMLSGRYPSSDFAELRARLVWDRTVGTVRAREGAKRLAIINGGTIPDRGLFGVFLATEDAFRVGELDEEMVFESKVGDVFVLGASSWQIQEITHDKVLVTPAPGVPGRMPFWKADRPGRPLELGRRIGQLSRYVVETPAPEVERELSRTAGLDPRAVKNLIAYQVDQLAAARAVPTDRTILVERFKDELGDWRVCVLTPFGARVHAPWAMAVAARIGEELPQEVDLLWSDDGIAFRLPEADRPPRVDWFVPDPDEVERRVTDRLAKTGLFAGRFRENAARALLLPRRSFGKRTPLFAQRRRAADLLAAASAYPDFPITLETYRSCLADEFDVTGLVELASQIRARELTVVTVDSERPSPYASALLFSWVGTFLYELDAPLAERRAQALAIDYEQLRALLGEAELRELFDPAVIEELERRQLHQSEPTLRHPDHLHDRLLELGDRSLGELEAQAIGGAGPLVEALVRERRAFSFRIGDELRIAAAEEAGRYRDAIGVSPPPGLPTPFLAPEPDALLALVRRYARTHGPFYASDVALRYGLGVGPVLSALSLLAASGKVLSGQFLPPALERRTETEWCDAENLKAIKRRSLARLRKAVEPVAAGAYARFPPIWHRLDRPGRGPDALYAAVAQLQGAALPAATLEAAILPARVEDYRPGDLDRLVGAGDVVWRGLGAEKVALYLAADYALLAPPPTPTPGAEAARVRAALARRGALFTPDLLAELSSEGPIDLPATLLAMTAAGEVTNDTLLPLRPARPSGGAQNISRRLPWSRPQARVTRRASEGRWSLLPAPAGTETERAAAQVGQLLERHGILARDLVLAEGQPGGFAAIYPILKSMEEAGQVARGYFVEGLGGAQFACPGADRALRAPAEPRTYLLDATDPASPFGLGLPWPAARGGGAAGRLGGAFVVLHDGELLGFLRPGGKSLLTFPAAADPGHQRSLAEALAGLAGRLGWLQLDKIDGQDARDAPLAAALRAAEFRPLRAGLCLRRRGGDDARG